MSRFGRSQPVPRRAVRPPSALAVSLADAGAGDDGDSYSDTYTDTWYRALTLAATVPVADGGTSTQALQAAEAVPLADTGTGAGTLTAATAIALADSGTAAEAVTVAASCPGRRRGDLDPGAHRWRRRPQRDGHRGMRGPDRVPRRRR